LWATSIFGTVVFTLRKLTGYQPWTKVEMSFLDLWGLLVFTLVVGLALVYPLEKLKEWLCPKLLFVVGRQTKEAERRAEWRGYVFVALLLGVVASLIAGVLLKTIGY
jgi:hypothetical protein